jgi:hypothetical protein
VPALLKTAFLDRMQQRKKIKSGAVMVGFFPWVEYKKLGQLSKISIDCSNSPIWLSVWKIWNFWASTILLKSVLDRTAAGEKHKFWETKLTETTGFPNTNLIGNSLSFLMVHFSTPNGQLQLSELGWVAEIEISGQTGPFDMNRSLGEISPWQPWKLRTPKLSLTNLTFLWLLTQSHPMHGSTVTSFQREVMVLNTVLDRLDIEGIFQFWA